MERISVKVGKEALEEFGFRCDVSGNHMVVYRNGEKIETLAFPVRKIAIDWLIQEAGF